MIVRIHLTSGEFVQSNYADQAVLDQIEKMLGQPDGVIRIPDDADVSNDLYGDEPRSEEYRRYTLIPVRSITHVEKL